MSKYNISHLFIGIYFNSYIVRSGYERFSPVQVVPESEHLGKGEGGLVWRVCRNLPPRKRAFGASRLTDGGANVVAWPIHTLVECTD